jgi:hypothetical protein
MGVELEIFVAQELRNSASWLEKILDAARNRTIEEWHLAGMRYELTIHQDDVVTTPYEHPEAATHITRAELIAQLTQALAGEPRLSV